MEQILGLIFAVLLSVAASWLDKWWKARKRTRHHRLSSYTETARKTTPPLPPQRYTQAPSTIVMNPENEGGSILQLRPREVSAPEVPVIPMVPDATAPEDPELNAHYARWRQALIDTEILAPRNF